MMKETIKIMSQMILSCILALLILTTIVQAENKKNCVAITSDSRSIYKLDLLNYKWVLDERWKEGKYYLPRISPRGRFLASGKYFENGFYILDSKSNKIIDHNNIDTGIDLLSWSPNEELLTFLGSFSNYKDKKVGDVYLYNLKTNELRKIYSFANCFDYPSPPSWNDSGDKIFFVDKDNMVIEFDIINNSIRKIVEGKGVHWISDSELLVRKEKDKYYLYNLKSKKETYLFKLGWWQYPPISLSPDKKIFLC